MDRNARTFATLFMVSDVSQRLRSALEFGAVIAIIMALISFAARNFETYIIQSQLSDSITGELKASIRDFYKDRGRFPSTNDEAGVPAPEHLIGNYVERVERH